MTIEFFTTASSKPAVTHLAVAISRHLANKDKVLWLVPGGSAIGVAVDISKMLDAEHIEAIENLTVSLTDERYGPAGHPGSNWQKLKAAGFAIKDAKLQSVLKNKSLEQTAKDYAQAIEKDLHDADYRVALTGIGADGHTFGIKPNSPATNSQELVSAYAWDDYVRLTLTPSAIERLDEIVVYAIGKEKHEVLDELDESIPPKEQPVQYLKTVRKITVYNDYKGTPL